MVAVPDPEGPSFPVDARGFAPLPCTLPTPPTPSRRVLMSSTTDPYSNPGFSAQCASAWNAQHRVLGDRGHLNADSGLFTWEYLEQLCLRQEQLWAEYLDELHKAGKSRDPAESVVKLML